MTPPDILDSLDDRASRQGGDVRGLFVRNGVAPLNLSGCANPHGPHPAALAAIAAVTGPELRDHPFTAVADFLDSYADYLGVDAAHLLPIRGITEGLRIIRRLFPDAVVIGPDYTESIKLFRVFPGSGRDSVDARVGRVAAAMALGLTVVLSNPSNPLSQRALPGRLVAIAAAHPQGRLVVDEAYVDFSRDQASVIGADLTNLVVLRASNKPFGMTGCRTGAMWTRDPALRAAASAELLTWPMSLLDAVATVAALDDDSGWLARTRAELLTVTGWMHTRLTALFGADALAPSVHFCFVRRTRPQLDRLWTHLGEHNIAVRVFPHGQPGRVPGMRILAPTAADWPQLEAALAAVTP